MYVHPGRAFIKENGLVEGPEDIGRYAAFLREKAGIDEEPPIDLSRILHRFGIPTPARTRLSGQQGLVVNADMGIILIEERDQDLRQKFTEAHELIELLFDALPKHAGRNAKAAGAFKHHAKERLCNEGAAELLMPEASFSPRVNKKGMCFETGRDLAQEYNVSLFAALVRMVKIGSGRHALVLWRMKNKPTEIQSKVPPGQLPLLDITQAKVAPDQLRVEQVFSTPGTTYIPTDKSVPKDSSIYAAWQDNRFTREEHWLDLGSIRGVFRCENQPFSLEGERVVLSLLHLPNDAGCPRCRC